MRAGGPKSCALHPREIPKPTGSVLSLTASDQAATASATGSGSDEPEIVGRPGGGGRGSKKSPPWLALCCPSGSRLRNPPKHKCNSPMSSTPLPLRCCCCCCCFENYDAVHPWPVAAARWRELAHVRHCAKLPLQCCEPCAGPTCFHLRACIVLYCMACCSSQTEASWLARYGPFTAVVKAPRRATHRWATYTPGAGLVPINVSTAYPFGNTVLNSVTVASAGMPLRERRHPRLGCVGAPVPDANGSLALVAGGADTLGPALYTLSWKGGHPQPHSGPHTLTIQ